MVQDSLSSSPSRPSSPTHGVPATTTAKGTPTSTALTSTDPTFRLDNHDLLLGLAKVHVEYAQDIFKLPDYAVKNGTSLNAIANDMLFGKGGLRQIFEQVVRQLSVPGHEPSYDAIAAETEKRFYDEANIDRLIDRALVRFESCSDTYKQFHTAFLADLSDAGKYNIARNILYPGPLGSDFGRFGKAALARVLLPQNQNMVIHFALDGLDIQTVVDKRTLTPAGDEAHGKSPTSRELRSAYRLHLLFGEAFDSRIKYYQDGKEVPAPWISRPEQWQAYKPKLADRFEPLLSSMQQQLLRAEPIPLTPSQQT
ncbi:MAG: hypothetical protein V4636_15565 [Pseudomonadota bacterium]